MNPYVIVKQDQTTVFCQQCDRSTALPVTAAQMARYRSGETAVQDVFPDLAPRREVDAC